MGEGPIKEPPKRAVLSSTASGARQRVGPIPLTIPSSVIDSRRTASQRTSLLSPLTPQRSPGKKTGSGDSCQMAYLTEKVAKLEKKLKMTKKHGRKHACDSSDSGSNSD